MSGIICPSYKAGFASPQRGRLRWPSLWRGCVGAWAPCLGQSGTTLRDNSGYGNHGTLTNMDPATDWVASGGKMALSILTDTKKVALPGKYAFVTGSSFSVAGWIYPTILADFPTIIGQRKDATQFEWALRIGTSKASFLPSTGGSVVGTTTITTGRFWHIAATCINGAVTVYLNGIPETTATGKTIAANANVTQATIGNWETAASTGCAYGYLDDVRVNSPALTTGEIATLASSRGVANETTHRRSYKAAVAQPAITANNLMLLGVG